MERRTKEKKMKKINKKDLKECFEQAKSASAKYVAVSIETRGINGLEVIINPKENFTVKQVYYEKAYTDDLVLKTYDGIRIRQFCWGDTFAELEAILNCKAE